eukprot:1328553-Prymnesium_polylepis.1
MLSTLLSLPLALGCQDRHALCFLWSTVGECEAQQPYMSAHCAASCSLCEEEELSAIAVDGTARAAPVRDSELAGSRIVHVDTGIPVQHFATFADPVTHLDAGHAHVVLLTAGGEVWTWGDDRMRQLGIPLASKRRPFTRWPPTRVEWPEPHARARATAIDAGKWHSAAVLEDGTLYCWGDNSYGQCGLPAELTPADAVPSQLELADLVATAPLRVAQPAARWRAVSCGDVHTVALTAKGEVWAWGDSSYGATGPNASLPTSDEAVPADAARQLTRVELPLEEGEAVSSVVAGSYHSLLTTTHGRVLGFGDNTHGQLGEQRKAGY